MNEKEFLKERFKTAITSAVKAISDNSKLQITFGKTEESKDNFLNLPDVASLSKLEDFTNLRAFADSEALKIKYTDKAIYLKNEPEGTTAKKLYAIAEKIRYEKIGSNKLKGVKNNIVQCYEKKFKDKKISEVKTEADVSINEAFELYLRSHFFKIKQTNTTKKILSYWKDLFNEKLKWQLKKLDNCIEDQSEFDGIVAQLIKDLEFEDSNAEKNAEQETKAPEEDKDTGTNENENNPSHQNLEEESTESEISLDDLNIDTFDEQDSADKSTTEENMENPTLQRMNEKNLRRSTYKVFSKNYDEIVKAEDLENKEEIIKLRKSLDQQLINLKNLISKLANKLQRKLLARQNRSWEFDLEEGILDTARLTRVVTDPFLPLTYKKEKDIDFKDTVVTLLVDNSGSMRGRPISIAAICGDILSRTLERCFVKVEILGFTTKNWKGGKSREEWNLNNKPSNPGRLNDLRHIIYKSADTPWRQSKNNLGLMLKEGLLKENIDGEAILWAFKRISKRKEERKILMVISDGAPVDDSTLSVNSGNYLEKHLKQTVKFIENKSDVEILAIGIGHDVTRYYKRAVKITDVQELGDIMINQLTELFSEKIKKTIH